jgi:hypothetical protein
MAINPVVAALDEVLWRDFDPASSFPTVSPLLAHYTSVATLDKILAEEELWLSNPLYMNDLEELRFGMNWGAEKFRSHPALLDACKSAKAHASLIQLFDEHLADFENMHAMDVYVMCFAEHRESDNDGVLSMWRGYGANGSGVAVVFDSSRIQAVSDSPFVVGKVTYASQQQRREWIDLKIKDLAGLIGTFGTSHETLSWIARSWLARLKLFALFTKHDGFSEEKEWRVAYISDRDDEARFSDMLGYAITARGVEPKLKIKVGELPGKLSLDTLINRIVLGPSLSSTLATESIRRMLKLKRRNGLASKVVASSIPFRA